MSKPNRPNIKPPSFPTRSQKNQVQLKPGAQHRPVAPPIYRPQPVPKVLQTKIRQPANGQILRALQTNRPQPPSKVLQRTRNTNQPQLKPVAQSRPIAPPVYRPQPVPKVLQTKMATQRKSGPVVPPAQRPQPTPKVLQRKTNTNQPAKTLNAPNRSNTIQRAWVRINGTLTWDTDETIGSNRFFQQTGEQAWYSSWRPSSLPFVGKINEKHDIYEPLRTQIAEKNKNADEMQEILAEIAGNKYLTDISLTRCTFPEWSTACFSRLNQLHSLVIYSPRGKDPSDHLAGLAKNNSLVSLALVMCHFMDDQCYQNLGKMQYLKELSLMRTVTQEFAPGKEAPRKIIDDGKSQRSIRQLESVSPAVITALKNLMSGHLTVLDLSGCTGLKNDLEELAEHGRKYHCRITYSDNSTKKEY